MNEDLLYTWEDSVENFYKFVEECCGVKKESEIYQTLQLLVGDMHDLEVFIDHYDGNMSDLKSTINRMVLHNREMALKN